ncbi:unnamed protein product [Brugia pahangi]|uniref:Uncharacterized protein n=1 Tax=Brugia pahangi TaxID=6280 RepID=A0A0N4TEG8_BRUPA|nr:unnamed protein product [Brugia pahangi]
MNNDYTERRNGTTDSITTHQHDSSKQHNDLDECSADRSISAESFDQMIPTDYKLSSQQTKTNQQINDKKFLQNKLTTEYDYVKKNRTKSPERLRQQQQQQQQQQPGRSFDDQNQR